MQIANTKLLKDCSFRLDHAFNMQDGSVMFSNRNCRIDLYECSSTVSSFASYMYVTSFDCHEYESLLN